MTLAEALQLYAPLLGIIALAFWSGVLSQKVSSLRERVAKLEREGDGDMKTVDRLARLETKMDTNTAGIEKLNRGMEGVQRQLGNLMQKGGAGAAGILHD